MSFGSFRMGMGLRSMRGGSFSALKSGGLSRLKSGGAVSGRRSAMSGGSISRSSIKSMVLDSLRTDTSDTAGVSGKVDSALSKEYVGALEAQAAKDAAAGVYKKDGAAGELQDGQMKKYVSPDRDAAIAKASKLLSGGGLSSTTARLSGLPYTVSISKRWSGTTAELYDENGEKFASYDSKSGQWKSVDTKAEAQFKTASSSIYDEAYRAAQSKAGGGASSGLDVRA